MRAKKRGTTQEAGGGGAVEPDQHHPQHVMAEVEGVGVTPLFAQGGLVTVVGNAGQPKAISSLLALCHSVHRVLKSSVQTITHDHLPAAAPVPASTRP